MNEAGRRMIPLARPWFGTGEEEAATRAIRSGWVTQGPEVAAFEREFARVVGAPHACAVSNCTTALHLALRAAGVVPGDEVVTVSHSFIATANAIRYCGAIPVFVDIDPTMYNMDPARVDAACGPRTRAILVVHQMGMPANLPPLVDLARARQIPLIEDAACAIGSELKWEGQWQRIGKPHGQAACFSFHPRKVLTTGDGGMITTSNAEWDHLFRLWRQHSMSVPDTVRHGAREVVFEEYSELGYNYRMTDFQAAVGRVQLTRLETIVARRRTLARLYQALLKDVACLVLPTEPIWARSNWQSFCVRLPDGLDQRTVMQHMLDAGVATRRGIMCSHREPAYGPGKEPWSCGRGPGTCGCVKGRCALLTESEVAQDRTIVLPLFHEMSDDDAQTVVSALRQACSIHD